MNRPTRPLSLLAVILAGLLLRVPNAHAVAHMVGLGSIQKTTNAGTSWSFEASSGGELDGVAFTNDNQGIAVGTLGHVERTTDAGSTWTTITTPTSNHLFDVSFATDSIGYAVGTGVALKTTSGGRTWSAITFPSGACDGLGVWFTSTTTGVLISSCGGIFRTTDSGASWTTEISNTSARLEDVMFPSSTVGYVVGFNHTILKTTDGGVTWAAQTSPVTNTDLQGVYFTNTTTGWAVGTNGTILFTTDGGTTWTERGNPAGNLGLRCIGFANDQEGIIGGDGIDLRTLDGGLSWIQIFPSSDNYQEIAVRPSTPITGTVNVTVASNPVGRHFMVDGADWTATTTFRWLSGELHKLTADATQPVSAGEQYLFANWSDGGALSHNVSRTSNGTFTVTYTHQFKLTTTVGSGSGSVTPSSAFKDAGSAVTVTATPSTGYTFGSWTGTGTGSFTGTTDPVSVTMNGPITESANFTGAPITISIHSSPSGRTVVVDGVSKTTPATVTWTVGTTHTLNTASPQSGGTGTQFAWTSWSDAGARSHTVTASVGTTTYTANFKTQYLLTMTAPPSPYVSTPATGFYDAGSVQDIDCTKNPLQFSTQYFGSWTGTGSGSYSGVLEKVSITMNGPITETPNFSSFPSKLVWVGTNPTGLAFQVAGNSFTDTTVFRFLLGSNFTVATDSLQNASGSSRQRFLNWSDGGFASHTASAGPSAPDTLIATFRTQYMLTMVADTGVTVIPASDYHDRGSATLIQATPLPFFAWQGWVGSGSGAYTGGNLTQIVTISGPITESAHVVGVPIPQSIFASSPAVQYTVDGATLTGNHVFTWAAGSPHTISAVSPVQVDAGTRLVFANWSDHLAQTHVVAPLVPDTLALTDKTTYLLTMLAGAGGKVTPASGYFTPGAVNIKATPDAGKIFNGWSGFGTSPFTGFTNPVNLNLSGPTTETASFTDSSLVGVGDGGPLAFALEQNAPNPVRERGTTFAFTLPVAGEATLEVLDPAGRRVATLASGVFGAGRHTRVWDATGDARQRLGAGMYFYRLSWSGRSLVKRVVVAR